MQESGHIMLADFDLSIYVPHRVITQNFTKPYSQTKGLVTQPDYIMSGVFGTLDYIAPEMINNKQYTCVIDWWSLGILTYEMLFDGVPFIGTNDAEICRSISKCQLKIPMYTVDNQELSLQMKKLIQKLLKRKPEKRLGFKGGASEIKDHPIFRKVNFSELINQIPPIIPTCVDFNEFDDTLSEDTSEIIYTSDDMWNNYL